MKLTLLKIGDLVQFTHEMRMHSPRWKWLNDAVALVVAVNHQNYVDVKWCCTYSASERDFSTMETGFHVSAFKLVSKA